MYSGNSDRLLDAIDEVGREHVVFIKPNLDTRHSSTLLVSHRGRWTAARLALRVSQIPDLAGRNAVVAIDELQFFDPEIVDVLEHLRSRGRRIVAAGLDLDFLRRPFGIVPQVMEMADSVTRLQATCHQCGGLANFTQRLLDGKPAPEHEEVIKVGGTDLYEARCAQCYEEARTALVA